MSITSPTRYRRLRASNSLWRSRRLVFDRLEDRRLLTAGDPDLSFGNGGLLIKDFPAPAASGPASGGGSPQFIANVGTSGDFIVASNNPNGYIPWPFSTPSPYPHPVVVLQKFHADGTFDTNFGTDGQAVLPVPRHESIRGIAVQSDGSVIVGSSIWHDHQQIEVDSAIMRVSANGVVDSSFGVGGILFFPSSFISLTIDAQDNIFAVRNTGSLIVQKYSPLGALDASFANNGQTTVAIEGGALDPGLIAVDSFDRVVIAGTYFPNDMLQSDWGLLRLLPNGQPDSAFGNSGLTTTDITGLGGTEWLSDLALQPDGKLLLVGTALDETSQDFLLIRYDSTGSPDSS